MCMGVYSNSKMFSSAVMQNGTLLNVAMHCYNFGTWNFYTLILYSSGKVDRIALRFILSKIDLTSLFRVIVSKR